MPCDYSKRLKCLSQDKSTSCFKSFTGNKCTCIETDFWDGTRCVPKFLNGVITDNDCKCRHDLGLDWLLYESPYTCYPNNNKRCACPSDQYWNNIKCVPKKTQNDHCTISCQCKENLFLSCESYVNGYSCYDSFNGKRCLCNYITHWWDSSSNICG